MPALPVFVLLFATGSFAAVTRRFISSSGHDVGTCPPTAPCRLLQYALTQTAPGGEVVILDLGGFGGGSQVSITAAVNIVAAPGAYATVQTPTGGAAFSITVGATDTVRIRGVNILGPGSSLVGVGVDITAGGQFELTDMTIKSVEIGVRISDDVRVRLTRMTISDILKGVVSQGVNADPATSTLKVSILGTTIQNGSIGVEADNGSIVMIGQDQNRIMYMSSEAYFMNSVSVTACSVIDFGVWNGYFNAAPTGGPSAAGGTACSTP